MSFQYRTIFIAAIAALTTFATSANAVQRPNVILIMTDDQGSGDFGAAGNELIETPNIDAMARRSASMTTFYVSPVCSPTRACLMTGRYNYRTKVIDTWVGRSMMDPEEVTVAEVLKEAGYATGIFGKWHLGDCYPMRPNDQGFIESLVHRGGGLAQPSEPRENNRRYTDPILFRNGEQVETKGYCTDVYFDAARDFIAKCHADEKPFFVYLPTNAPHGPYHDVPPELLEEYKRKDLSPLVVGNLSAKRREGELDRLARIAAMITNVDQNVGRVFEQLNSLNLTDNTLVMFLVDNGPNTRRYVGNRRGMKSEVHDGGIRSPFWAHWPARLEAGHASDKLSAHIDIMPTILAACNVPLPSSLQIDGRSLLPLLENKKADWPDRNIVIQSHRGDRPQRYHHFMIRDARWKLLHASGFGRDRFEGPPKFELYDMVNDPIEKQNLVDDQPKELARLKQAYDEWFDDVSSTRKDNYQPPRIKVGTPHETTTVLTRQDWRGGSWAPNSTGHWLIHIAEPGNYSIEVLFDSQGKSGEAKVTVSGRSDKQQHSTSRAASYVADKDSCRFPKFPFRKGNAKLEAVLTEDGKERGTYQVVITRQP